MMYIVKCTIALIIAAIATYQDQKYMKIKNYITAPGMLIGLLISPFWQVESLIDSVLGIAIPFILCLLLYITKMLIAGDIKLLMAIGAVMGTRNILWCMIFSMLVGGVIAIFIMIKRGIAKERFKVLFEYLKFIFITFRVNEYPSAGKYDARFPFGTAVICGLLLTILNNKFKFI